MLVSASSRTIDLDGPTHYLDLGGPAGPPPLVCVHGLGGSHANWMAVAPALADRQRVYALDLAGHGLTLPDQRRADVDSNQRLLDRFLREVAGVPVVLMGNSMGGMISILQAVRHPDTVAALALVDPAIPGPLQLPDPTVTRNFLGYALPGVSGALLARRRRQLSPEQQVREVLSACCVDTTRIPGDVVEQLVALATRRQSVPGVDAAFLDAARSVLRHLLRRPQYLAEMRSIQAPVLVLHGARDRLVPANAVRMAVRDNPHWELHIAEDVGHVPQLEAPGWTVERYRQWAHSTGVLTEH